MRCPSCGYQKSKVVDSRSADDGASIRRRRECLQCGTRFTTYERLAENPILVIKADGSSEVFNREKLMRKLNEYAAGKGIDVHIRDCAATFR